MPQYESETELALDVKEPGRYRVVMHNDDYTPMDFVVFVLIDIFAKNREEAEMLMWRVHEKGRAVCGVYTHEIAQMKAEQVVSLARQNSFPLLATVEEDEEGEL